MKNLINLNAIIASNLKRLRTERNLSLSKLSALSGVSKVMLGQIEHGESNPTINTVWKIATGLNVPYTSIIDEPKSDTTLIKKDDIIKQMSEDGHYRIYNYYSTNSHRNFEFFTAELDKESSYYSRGHGDNSEEYILVIQGILTLETANMTYTLNEGDSVRFNASYPHLYKNNLCSMVQMSIINYYT